MVAAGLNVAGVARFLPWVEPPTGPFGVGFTADLGDDCEPGVIYMACDDDGYVGVVRLEDGRTDIAAALRSGAVGRVGGHRSTGCTKYYGPVACRLGRFPTARP